MYVYVLSSLITKRKYTGITSDIEDRLRRHFAGYEKPTQKYLPMELIFLIDVENRSVARQMEIYLKSGIGREFIDEVAGLPAGRQV